MKSLCLTALLVAAVTYQAKVLELVHQAQYTNTSEVRDIALTRDRVWAATGGGLAVHRRSDGRFLFKLTSADGLPGNSLRLVRALENDRLLVGGDFGAAVLRHANKGKPGAGLEVLTLRSLSRPDSYSPISALLQSSPVAQGGPILIALQRGLMKLKNENGGKLSIKREIGPPQWWNSAAVSNTHIALGDLTGRLAIYPIDAIKPGGTWKPERETFLDGPVLSLAWNSGALVAATGEGLYRIAGQRLRQLYQKNQAGKAFPVAATVLTRKDHRRLLVGTAKGSVLELEGVKFKPAMETQGQRITAILYSKGKMWLGVAGVGLHLGKRSLRPKGEICSNHVTKMTVHRNVLVAGTFDQGACYLTKRGWKTLKLPAPMVHGLASDGYYLYVANSAEISRFGPKLRPRPIGERDPKLLQWFSSQGATSATTIRKGLVAISSKFGIIRIWRKRRGRSRVRYANHEKGGAPWKLTALAASQGKLFAASESDGVKRMGFGGEDWLLQDPHELTENWVTSISPVSADEIWVATCQQGAVHVKKNGQTQVRRFGTRQGLPDMRLTAVAAGRKGAFLGTLNGLAWADNKQNRAKTFGLENGLPDPRSAMLYRKGNRLWIGTEAGLARFRVAGID